METNQDAPLNHKYGVLLQTKASHLHVHIGKGFLVSKSKTSRWSFTCSQIDFRAICQFHVPPPPPGQPITCIHNICPKKLVWPMNFLDILPASSFLYIFLSKWYFFFLSGQSWWFQAVDSTLFSWWRIKRKLVDIKCALNCRRTNEPFGYYKDDLDFSLLYTREITDYGGIYYALAKFSAS